MSSRSARSSFPSHLIIDMNQASLAEVILAIIALSVGLVGPADRRWHDPNRDIRPSRPSEA